LSQHSTEGLDLDTLAVRSGIERSQFNEHSEALYLTSSFVFEQRSPGCRAVSPGRLRATSMPASPTRPSLRCSSGWRPWKGAEACVATASGMAAILSTVMALAQRGRSHRGASRGLFGATQQLFGNILSRFGIETTFVPATDLDAYKRRGDAEDASLFFVESPSNPLTELGRYHRQWRPSRTKPAPLLAVDNCFCSPALQQPLKLGADLVIHSATKYLDGQGRVLGGAVCGSKTLVDEVLKFLRTAGPCDLAVQCLGHPQGARDPEVSVWRPSRPQRIELASWLEAQPQVARVYYPGLPSHPQYELAQPSAELRRRDREFRGEGRAAEEAWQVVDATRVVSITANLGDTKTTLDPSGVHHPRAHFA
jgi:O-succinylhomoserine sulfhydrylase